MGRFFKKEIGLILGSTPRIAKYFVGVAGYAARIAQVKQIKRASIRLPGSTSHLTVL